MITKKFRELQKRARKKGLSLWENGGYYYLSGFIRGKHRQGIFSSLKGIETQLSEEKHY